MRVLYALCGLLLWLICIGLVTWRAVDDTVSWALAFPALIALICGLMFVSASMGEGKRSAQAETPEGEEDPS